MKAECYSKTSYLGTWKERCKFIVEGLDRPLVIKGENLGKIWVGDTYEVTRENGVLTFFKYNRIMCQVPDDCMEDKEVTVSITMKESEIYYLLQALSHRNFDDLERWSEGKGEAREEYTRKICDAFVTLIREFDKQGFEGR